MSETKPRLWEIDHPYYCTEGNFYSNKNHTSFASWEEFATPAAFMQAQFVGNALYDWDDDLNFLFRWDWKKADADNYFLSPGDPDDETADLEEATKTDRLMLFFMAQRKARNMSASVTVTEADEPAVREWLTKKAEYMRTMWAPLLDAEPTPWDERAADAKAKAEFLATAIADPEGQRLAAEAVALAVPGWKS